MPIIINNESTLIEKCNMIRKDNLNTLLNKQKELIEKINFWSRDNIFDDEYFKSFVEENLIFSGYILYCIKYEESLTEEEFNLREMDTVVSTSRQYVYNDTKCCMRFSPLFVNDYAPEVLDRNYLFFKYMAKYFFNKDLDKNSDYLFMNESVDNDYSLSQSIVVNFSGMYGGHLVKPGYKILKSFSNTLNDIEGIFIDNKCDMYDYYNEDMRWYFKFNEVFISEFIIPLIREKWRQEFIEVALINKIKEINMINKLKQ